MVLNSPFTKTLYIHFLPLLFWTNLSELSEMLPPGLQSSFCPQIKLNSQLSSCTSFLVDTTKPLPSPSLMQNAGMDKAQAGIKIAGGNINNLRYADDTTLMAESEEELKSLLMKVKEESEKVGLKVSIQKQRS